MGGSDTRVMGSYGVADLAPLESLAQLRVLAERDASRYAGEEPARGRRSAKPRRFGRVWRWSVRIGAIALLGIALWVLAAVGATLVPSEDVPAAVASRMELQSTMHAPTTGVYSQLAAQPAERLLIARERGVWRIQADAASRHEAAQTLAELSGTHLPAGLEALRSTRPLDLQWEGHDLAQAWQAVIGDEANYALKCSQRRCMAWLVAVAQSHSPRGLTMALEAAPAPVAAVQRTERNIEGAEPSAYD